MGEVLRMGGDYLGGSFRRGDYLGGSFKEGINYLGDVLGRVETI